ncbi:MAG: response regulator transcription factor [Bacteroidota bacterium]
MPDPTLTQPLRLIIADDAPAVRQRVRTLLAGHASVTIDAEVASADDLIERLHTDQPDAVLLDINMPGSGISALRHIKGQHPQVRVVMLTNHSGPYYRRLAKKAGADYFLDKSMEFEQIPAVLAQIARGA